MIVGHLHDCKLDRWAFGVTLYWLRFGKQLSFSCEDMGDSVKAPVEGGRTSMYIDSDERGTPDFRDRLEELLRKDHIGRAVQGASDVKQHACFRNVMFEDFGVQELDSEPRTCNPSIALAPDFLKSDPHEMKVARCGDRKCSWSWCLQ